MILDMDVDETALPLIYFITAVEKRRFPIKIGRSTTRSIRRRIETIQIGVPYELGFLYVIEAPASVETEIHEAFSDLRLRGEWFRRTYELDGFIKEMCRRDPDWRQHLHPRWKLKMVEMQDA